MTGQQTCFEQPVSILFFGNIGLDNGEYLIVCRSDGLSPNHFIAKTVQAVAYKPTI